ncbi:hypothetical protein [Nonlabens marinus]|uniref:Uncharacterized protein n=1 Tax=Nonlabens marinus S1-08 TaxID=1454201 RepID=W8VPK8_9FLAO|nr:hypothetical protein [Nonlabens marinus]BAO55104.1 hypothetical protein NMS_1095 [Nonlabens marinus S1-08]
MIWNFKLRNCFVAILAICCLISCEKDEIQIVTEESIFPEITGRVISAKDLASKPIVYSRLMDYLQKPVAKSSSGIELDTSYIKVMETDRYTSFTFKIKQDSMERQHVLRNFMLTMVNDTIQIQHLVDYSVLSDGSLDMNNIQMKRLVGEELLNLWQPKCGGTTVRFESYMSCFMSPCSSRYGHTDPSECDFANSSYVGSGIPPTEVCIELWREVSIREPRCIDSGPSSTAGGEGDGSNGPGGSGTAADTDEQPDEDDDILIGMDPNDGPDKEVIEKDCINVGEKFGEPKLKAELDKLKQNTRLNHETGIDFQSNGEVKNLEVNGRNRVTFIPNLQSLIAGHVHVNQMIVGDKLETQIPIFSPADFNNYLLWLKYAKNSGIDIYSIIPFLIIETRDIRGNPTGNYETLVIKYNGRVEDLPNAYPYTPDQVKKYAKRVPKSLKRNFLKFLKNESNTNLDKFNFYKIDNQGEVSEFYLDDENILKSKKCYEN